MPQLREGGDDHGAQFRGRSFCWRIVAREVVGMRSWHTISRDWVFWGCQLATGQLAFPAFGSVEIQREIHLFA
jgi:hypothetical protein